ncbi:hypothetical protein [Agrobacterium burrii]
MSLRERLKTAQRTQRSVDVFSRYGVLTNPFPASNQTSNNPHFPSAADDEVESRIVSFMRDGKSQVVVIEGTQGVGKTNLLNHFEQDIHDALSDDEGYYVVRYLADPEKSFDGTIRQLFLELGQDHYRRLAEAISSDPASLSLVRSTDLKAALKALSEFPESDDLLRAFEDWLLGLRLLKIHREGLGVQFRLDTVESKTAALRDIVVISSELSLLKGVFLLLDELEKQDGVLGPAAIVRYLSAMRAIMDALPKHLFMMLAITPDAMRRYSSALPAFRSRLQNQIVLSPLKTVEEAIELANFYVQNARREAERVRGTKPSKPRALVSTDEMEDAFLKLLRTAERRGDDGVRQREFLHQIHLIAEKAISQ